jgi:putative membrane protein
MMWDGHWREMMGWGLFPWGPLHMMFSLTALALLIAFIISLFGHPRGGSWRSNASNGAEKHSMGMAILEERYVRGEIDREEFVQKKRDLTG